MPRSTKASFRPRLSYAVMGVSTDKRDSAYRILDT